MMDLQPRKETRKQNKLKVQRSNEKQTKMGQVVEKDWRAYGHLICNIEYRN